MTFLGCLDNRGLVTSLGHLALRLPLDPRRAVTVIKAAEIKLSVVWEISAVLSLLEEGNLRFRPDDRRSWADLIRASFADSTGDHMALFHMFRAYNKKEATSSKPQLEHWCDQHFLNSSALTAVSETWHDVGRVLRGADESVNLKRIPDNDLHAQADQISAFFRKMLLNSSFLNVAVYEKGDTYRTLAENQPSLVHPSSALPQGLWDFVIYDEFADVSSKPYLYGVTGIDPRWLCEVPAAAAYMKELMADPGKKNFFSIQQLAKVRDQFKKNTSTA